MKHRNKSGLMAKKVHTKTGMRTYWVKAGAAAKRAGGAIKKGAAAVGRGAMKHKGKIAAAAALTALGLHLAGKHKGALQGAFRGARASMQATGEMNKAAAALGSSKMHFGVLTRLRHAAGDARAGARAGNVADVARAAERAGGRIKKAVHSVPRV